MTLTEQLNRTNAKIRLSFERRALISLQKNKLWQIESGIIRTSGLLDDGSLVVFGLWQCGDVVGKAIAGVDTYQIECLTPVEVVCLHGDDNHLLNEIVFAHVQQLQELTLIRSNKRVDVMLLKLLAWLAQKFGRAVVQGQLIELRLTHQDLADLLGSTRVTITRTLSQLEQQGLIERASLHRIILREEEVWHYQI